MPRVVVASKAIDDIVFERDILRASLDKLPDDGTVTDFVDAAKYWIRKAEAASGIYRRAALVAAVGRLVLEIERFDGANGAGAPAAASGDVA